jgi:hypothetical protein
MATDLFSFLGEPVLTSSEASTRETIAVLSETYDDDDLMPETLLSSTSETRVPAETYDDDDQLVINLET